MSARYRKDAHDALGQRLDRYLARQPECAARLTSRSQPWASVTFNGARHQFVYHTGDERLVRRLRTEIVETEFDLPGHIVADIRLSGAGGRMTVEALTVEIG